MAKYARLKTKYRSNASKLHKAIGKVLKLSSLTKNLQIYQEYPVNKINPNWPNARAKYDWVILSWKVVIEAMGEQHRRPVMFGDMTKEEAESKFRAQQRQDRAKKKAALSAGWQYITIWYDEKPTISLILSKIEQTT